jgi:hypothetical protein
MVRFPVTFDGCDTGVDDGGVEAPPLLPLPPPVGEGVVAGAVVEVAGGGGIVGGGDVEGGGGPVVVQLLDDIDPVGDLGVSLGQSVHTDAPLPLKYLPAQYQQGSVIRHEPIIK